MAKTIITPATPWVANSTSPQADQSYQNGDRPPSSFVPEIIRNFNSGTIGQSAQAEFGDGGSTNVYANTNPVDGTTYIDSTAITGNSNDFTWGGYLYLDTPLVQDDEFWYQVQIRPEDDMWTDSNPRLKFLRLRENTSGGSNSGYADLYLDGTTSGRPRFIKEGVDQWKIGPDSAGPTVEAWNKYEMYLKLHSNGAQGQVRIWKDNVLVIDETTQTMNNADGNCPFLLLFTYWNGEPTLPTVDHTVGIDNIIIGTNASPPTNTDTAGNLFIGNYTP